MASSTQVRGIHQALFIQSQDNKGAYAGVNPRAGVNSTFAATFIDNADIKTYNSPVGTANRAGSYVAGRYAVLLEGGYVERPVPHQPRRDG